MTTTSLPEERLIATAKTLPAGPRIMARLNRMLLDSSSGMADIAALLRCDIALTTRIIQVANSPVYKGRGVGSIEEALQRVGFTEVFRLVGVVANASLSDARLRCYGYPGEVFRRHSLCAAFVAEALAERTRSVDARLAYTTGLLRGIGCILLDRAARDMLSDAETFPESGNGHLTDWERRSFGVSRFDVAALLLKEWDFPAPVVMAVGVDALAAEPQTPLGRILQLTQAVVRSVGFELPGEECDWGISGERLAAMRLSIDEVSGIGENAVRAMLTAEQALG